MKQLVQKTFKPEDALVLMGNSIEKNPKIDIDKFEILGNQSVASTWWYNDSIIGCGGIVIYEEGKCVAWSIIDKELAMPFKRELMVGSKRFLNKVAKENRITYMKASWQVNFAPEIHWLEHLGFEKEDEVIEVNGMKAYVYSRRFKWESL